ncbi:hypothetical protein SDC9_209368 [bioreactor metagenome]|uniref:Uncharacterized protein n=1 Tax=bioreactor metagenome TaxID=1076179 RepID=A0A645JEW9_9ZZZZ
MFEFRMSHYVLGSSHNFSHSGFVICSQKGIAVGCDYCLSFVICKFRKINRGDYKIFLLVDNNVSSIIIVKELWLYIFSGSIRRGVYVCYET